MKAIVLIGCLLFAVSFNSGAQEKAANYIAKPRLNIGAEFAIPSNTGFGERFSIGAGASAKFEVPVTKEFYITTTAGLIQFHLKEKYKNLTFNKNYVPLKAGGKYYIQRTVFAEGEAGVTIGTNSGAGSSFTWAAGTGISLPITKDGYLDTGIRYEKWARDGGNISQIGVRVAYKF